MFRVRLPGWHPWEFDPWEDSSEWWWTALLFLALIPALTVVPLVRFLAELPVAVGRGIFTRARWVEASCTWPAEIRILWRTTATHAAPVARQVRDELAQGYERLTPGNAEFVAMTPPPGLEDRDA